MIKHAYIHIPFCLRKCNYCSFVSGKNIEKKDIYISALLKEIKQKYKNEKLKTLYIGGGTPTLLDTENIKQIIEHFYFEKDAEITIEANPETIEKEKIKKIKKLGINRISLGVQTFNNDILKSIGRIHTEETIYNSIKTIKDADFSNISVDLIYGLPNQDINLFKKDLEKALSLDVQHISTYGLKIEEGSFFYKKPPKNIPNDEEQANMYSFLCKFLKENKFEHYEISNFAKEDNKSKHNCAYWKNKNYYGFGLNASGYENNIRYRNNSNLNEYIKNPLLLEEKIELSKEEIKEEEIFLALRLEEGIDIQNLNKKFNIDFEKEYKTIIEKYSKLNLLKLENGFCKLTETGILLSNEIMSEFIN